MVSIDEVAREAGVSTATVSRALSGRGNVSDPTRARVEAAAKSLGYVVSASASSLASGRTRNIGVLVPFLDRWFFSTVLSGTATALQRLGYDITLYNLTADPSQRREIFDTFLRRQRVDGVIAVSIELGKDETDRLIELDLPVIAIGGPNPRLTTLTVDDVAVARARGRAPHRARAHRDRAHRGEPRVRTRLPHPDTAAAGFRTGIGGCRNPGPPRALRACGLHDRGRLPRGEAAAGPPGRAADGDLRGVRRDGDRRAPRRARARVPRPGGHLGRRHRRARAGRVLPPHDGRPVPAAQGERAADAILASSTSPNGAPRQAPRRACRSSSSCAGRRPACPRPEAAGARPATSPSLGSSP